MNRKNNFCQFDGGLKMARVPFWVPKAKLRNQGRSRQDLLQIEAKDRPR